jgi:hypothetical protein
MKQHSFKDLVADSGEHVNEASGSMKGGEFLEKLNDYS